MNLVINGKPYESAVKLTVLELLKQLEATAPQVAVEVNKQLVPRSHHPHHQLADGDCVEVVTLVGGG